ncbi:MAG: B12-binding domain-containing radical SAM protein [Bacteroidales bacterium]
MLTNKRIWLVTPPFTQLNTPYPATAYIKGFFNGHQIPSFQSDLSLETMLRIFSRDGLTRLFDEVIRLDLTLSDFAASVLDYRDVYEDTIDRVIAFLQGRNRTLAYAICENDYLPVLGRETDEEEIEWAFGVIGMEDKARFIATCYLEDLTNFISETVDPEFGFSRYAERLGRCASSYDDLYEALKQPYRFTDHFLLEAVKEDFEKISPEIVLLTVPFPGNLYSGLRIAQWVKQHAPQTKIIMGGGFPNTELRSLSEPRLFELIDYVVLDDAEDSLLPLLSFIENELPVEHLVRTFNLDSYKNQVVYQNNKSQQPCSQQEVGTPDYSDLPLDKYISVIERLNPMHKLWSDGRWNKLTLAHGCYWGKCSFCDGSLDYIGRYAPNKVADLVDRIEKIVRQTGEIGFHFVDEAAPPALLKALSEELLRRNVRIVWWGNVRFEKSFTAELCDLMKEAGCIAVSGGLEVASERILKLINKGVNLEQVAQVTRNFTEAGILVHAYLMYGFPTQTEQETIDSLEVVRQLFEAGLVQSGFWHRFALTAHSPVGLDPDKFNIRITEPEFKGFARNDLQFEDPTGGNHDKFGEGLRISLYNYMNGTGFDLPLNKWFEAKVPRTTLPPNYIQRLLSGGGKKKKK